MGKLPAGPGSLSGGRDVPQLSSQLVEACNGFPCGQCHSKAASVQASPTMPSASRIAVPQRKRLRAPRALLGVAALAACAGVVMLLRLGQRLSGGLGGAREGEKSPLMRVPPRAVRRGGAMGPAGDNTHL